MTFERIHLGKSGEDAALDFLRGRGYAVVARNYRTRAGEIDIIAYDRDTVCFIEVKTRRSGACGCAHEAVSAVKRRKISRTALWYLKEKNLLNRKARFDVVAVTGEHEPFTVDIIKNAFELEAGDGY